VSGDQAQRLKLLFVPVFIGEVSGIGSTPAEDYPVAPTLLSQDNRLLFLWMDVFGTDARIMGQRRKQIHHFG